MGRRQKKIFAEGVSEEFFGEGQMGKRRSIFRKKGSGFSEIEIIKFTAQLLFELCFHLISFY